MTVWRQCAIDALRRDEFRELAEQWAKANAVIRQSRALISDIRPPGG
jgi:hypothetical protein